MIKTKIVEISEKDLLKIDVNKLKVNKFLPFDVYVEDGGIRRKIFNKGAKFSNLFSQTLKEKGFTHVYIELSDEEVLDSYLAKKISPESALDSPIAFKNYSFSKENLYQIDRSLIIPRTEVNFPIYIIKNFNITKIVDVSAEKNSIIYNDTIPEEGDILIEKKDLPLFKEYLNSLEAKLNKADEQPNKELKEILVKENAKMAITDVLNEPRSGERIKKVENIVNNIIETIFDNPDSIYKLISLKGYDYYTYIHSVNVGVLSIGLGIQIGIDKDILYKLGIGAILHDLGKTQIPNEILNKQGRLNNTEYNIIKQHVLLGYKLLKEQKEFPEESSSAVLQHHEKLSGKGYPFGLKGSEIKLFGRITAIADCYDALTTQRPYKPPLTPYFALSIIVKEKGDHDADLLKSFIKMLGKIK